MADLWNPHIANDINTQMAAARTNFQNSKSTIDNQIEQYALQIPSAKTQIEQAKSVIQNSTQKMRELSDRVTAITNNVFDRMSNLPELVRAKKQTQADAREKLENDETVAHVRDEQVHELRNRNSSNYHSSWLGIWRPLKEDSRVGLFVASIVLGSITILSILFLMSDPFLKLLPASSPIQPSLVKGKFTGGFWNILKKIK